MSEEFDTAHWPTEVTLKKAEKLLEISFDNGRSFRLPAEYLRVESPSAEVQGHGAGQKSRSGAPERLQPLIVPPERLQPPIVPPGRL